MRFTGVFVRRMNHRFPVAATQQRFPIHLRLKHQPGLTAALVTEPVLAEIPEQDSNRVVAPAEILCQVNPVVIGIVGRRPAFQLTFEHHPLAIDPEPVFRVGRDPRDGLAGCLIKTHHLAETDPAIGRPCGWPGLRRDQLARGQIQGRVFRQRALNGLAINRILQFEGFLCPVRRVAAGRRVVGTDREVAARQLLLDRLGQVDLFGRVTADPVERLGHDDLRRLRVRNRRFRNTDPGRLPLVIRHCAGDCKDRCHQKPCHSLA